MRVPLLVHSGDMRTPRPLPPLLGDLFTFEQARASGVTPARLRASDLVRPFHGVRARGAVAETLRLGDRPFDSLSDEQQQALIVARARAFGLRLQPGEHFSHTTAALLWGLPLPRLDDPRIHVTVPPQRARRKAHGVAFHASARPAATTRPGSGMPVSAPSAVWTSLGRVLGMHDLVALGDNLVRTDRHPWPVSHLPAAPPLATLEQLRLQTQEYSGQGRARLRQALPFVRTDSWSRPESLLRLHLIDDGLPEPQLNVDIFDGADWLACVDGCLPAYRVHYEYHGAPHFASRAQVISDIERRERLARRGGLEVTLTAEHVLSGAREDVRRVRSALQLRELRARR